MAILYLKRGLWMLLLLLLQVLVLNHIHIGGYATPFMYVYFLLIVNKDVSRQALMLLGFVLGLAIDVFSNTPGVNAAAATLLAFVRPSLLNLFASRDSAEDMEPGMRAMGLGSFCSYALLSICIHHTVLMVVDTFSFFHWGVLLLKILCSTLLTGACVMAAEFIRKK